MNWASLVPSSYHLLGIKWMPSLSQIILATNRRTWCIFVVGCRVCVLTNCWEYSSAPNTKEKK